MSLATVKFINIIIYHRKLTCTQMQFTLKFGLEFCEKCLSNLHNSLYIYAYLAAQIIIMTSF